MQRHYDEGDVSADQDCYGIQSTRCQPQVYRTLVYIGLYYFCSFRKPFTGIDRATETQMCLYDNRLHTNSVTHAYTYTFIV